MDANKIRDTETKTVTQNGPQTAGNVFKPRYSL